MKNLPSVILALFLAWQILSKEEHFHIVSQLFFVKYHNLFEPTTLLCKSNLFYRMHFVFQPYAQDAHFVLG